MGNCSCGKETAGPAKTNRAFVFIKPHAQTPYVQSLVRSKLEAAKITILSEGTIGAEDIDKKQLIDQHYYAIASKATLLDPEKLPVPADKFKDKFGENWSDVLAKGRAANAMQACNIFGISAEELEVEWRKCEPAGTVVKFGGGFYCGKMIVKDKTLYVFNAFFMAMRSKFTAPGCSIYYFSVSWNPGDLPWSQFRGSILGPTDPAAAPAGSIRNQILQQWSELGLKSAPNKGDNGVHASASPFEGLAEEMNWLGTDLSTHPLGSALVVEGVPETRIKEWSTDPQVKLEDGSKGSIFDALEDLDVKECYNKLLALNLAQ
mmetsp:Transcript_154210/g.287492  ORF Transcript_154210/g.287492 Transcript_154210/m.287492 type:complete len:319 (-) Transcript_154210:279-1235(-)